MGYWVSQYPLCVIRAWLPEETQSPPRGTESLQAAQRSSRLIRAGLRKVGPVRGLGAVGSASHMTTWVYDVACLHGRVAHRSRSRRREGILRESLGCSWWSARAEGRRTEFAEVCHPYLCLAYRFLSLTPFPLHATLYEFTMEAVRVSQKLS